MNIRTMSNVFNQIAQAMSIPYYHYGWNSDVNRNVQNNFTGDNTDGKNYPSIHCNFGNSTVDIKQKGGFETTAVQLVFQDLQYYNNDSTTNTRSILDAQADLRTLALDFLSNVNALGRALGGTGLFGITGQVRMEDAADYANDRTVVCVVNFTLQYIADCPTDVLSVSDITALPAPFNVFPPDSVDFEQL